MATIHPDGWQALPATGAAQRELQSLHAFYKGLPDGYVVYHGVHWTRVQDGHQLFGEVDFVIVGPSGRVLLIEQKSGFLSERRTWPDQSIRRQDQERAGPKWRALQAPSIRACGNSAKA